MDSEKYVAVSGLLFLVSLKSFEIAAMIAPATVKTCELAPRFAYSLLLSTFAVATVVAFGFSAYYLRVFMREFCRERPGL